MLTKMKKRKKWMGFLVLLRKIVSTLLMVLFFERRIQAAALL